MGIFDDSFLFELKHPINTETWNKLIDAEFNNAVHVHFATPSGKRVDFIKADVLDKIRAEIELHRRKTESIDPYDLVGDCLEIIDKYKTESEEVKE